MNNIIKTAKLNLEQKKYDAEKRASDILQTLLMFPDFNELYKQTKTFEIENAQALAQDLKEIHNITNQQQLLTECAKSHGYNYEQIKPVYSCNKCCDTGICNGKQCDCLNAEISRILISKSGISNIPDFSEIDYSVYKNQDTMKTICNKMKDWCNKPVKYKNILFYGKVGVGKTHLSYCMANELINNNYYVYYVTAFELNQQLLNYHSKFEQKYQTFIDNYLKCDCLIIDDLGTEAIIIDSYKNDIFNIINQRTINNKRTIITTNLNLQQLEDLYGERFLSRIVDKRNSISILIDNDDIRLKNIKK